MSIINYMWNMKPNEKNHPDMKIIESNSKYLQNYKILQPTDINPLVQKYSEELFNLWNQIPSKYWVIKADLGRLLYIYYNGDYYLDIDCIIKKNFITDNKYNIFLFTEIIVNSVKQLGPRECKNPENVLRVANYAFGSKIKEHPFIKNVIDECINRLKFLFNLNQSIWSIRDILWVCGPDVITTIYHKLKNNHHDIFLHDQSYLNHLSFKSWHEK